MCAFISGVRPVSYTHLFHKLSIKNGEKFLLGIIFMRNKLNCRLYYIFKKNTLCKHFITFTNIYCLFSLLDAPSGAFPLIACCSSLWSIHPEVCNHVDVLSFLVSVFHLLYTLVKPFTLLFN